MAYIIFIISTAAFEFTLGYAHLQGVTRAIFANSFVCGPVLVCSVACIVLYSI